MLAAVLIIDKRKELSVKYKRCIDDTKSNAVIAKTLKDAMILLQNLEPELIIVSDSIEENLADFCKKIRALTYNTRPVIVALSKSADMADRINVLESGADDFISEPVNIEEFKSRIKAHIRRDIESNTDNVTLLPNSKYTKKVLKRILKTENNAVLAVCVDRLSEYKSVYSELAGDKIIQTFVAIAKSALDENDFIGELNENNFIIITNKYSAEKLAEFLTFAFDTVAPKFYSEADASRGYMLLNGEKYAGMRANFVSLMIGGIVEKFNLYSNTDILLERLNELKNMSKTSAGSNYIIDRTKLTGETVKQNDNKKQIYIKESDDALKYLIQTSLELQGYNIQEELKPENAEQPSVIIMDSGNNTEVLGLIRDLKTSGHFLNTRFIVTTTCHNKSEILDSGADLYLPKPYEISDLIGWVEYFIKQI